MSERRLKPGWRWVKFGEVVKQVKDRIDPQESGLERYVAGEHMDTDDLRIRRWGEFGDDYLGPAFHMRFKPGQVLYGSRRTYLRKVAVPDFEGICANTTFVLEPHDPKVLLPELLPFIMQIETFHEHSIKQSRGSVNPYVNFSDLAWYEFALPPLEEQADLVAVVQTLDGAEESYKAAINSANRLGRAVVDSRFSDYLRGKVETVALSGLTKGKPKYGVNTAAIPYGDSQYRFLRITDITDDGYLVDFDRVSVKIADPENYLVEANDLFFARTGASVGRSYLANGNEDQHVFAGYLIRYKIDPEKVRPEFVFAYTRTSAYRGWVEQTARSTAQPNINATEYSNLRIPIPSRDEQDVLIESLKNLRGALLALQERLAKTKQFRYKLINHNMDHAQ